MRCDCYVPFPAGDLYLVANGFAHEEGGDVQRQDVLEEELVDVLHGLHLLPLRLETAAQQEVDAAAQLVLTEREREREREREGEGERERVYILGSK